MRKRKPNLWLALVLSLAAVAVVGEPARSVPDSDLVPAFPGAEGYGSGTPGGRGGRVIEVTNLNDSGPGSLRSALTASGRRIVVFRAGGIIDLRDAIVVRDPYLTLAGQSAPGDGICLRGAGVSIRTHDVVVRHLRFRPGEGAEGAFPSSRDGVQVLDTKANDAHHIVVDHSSISWSVDENADTWNAPRDVTFQWNILSEGLRRSIHPEGVHSMGFLVGAGTRRISIHHNLFAHNNGRNPVFYGGVSGEVVNNVVYDWGYAGTEIDDRYPRALQPIKANVIGNYYEKGRDSSTTRKGILIWGGETGSEVYVKGNVGPGRPTDSGPHWRAVTLLEGRTADYRSAAPAVEPSGITTGTALGAYGRVLDGAGATLPARDPVDRRVVGSVRNGTGRIIDSPDQVGGYPTYREGNPPADGDHDGMPNGWESEHGLDAQDASDGSTDDEGDGYTNVEEYLNGTDPNG